MTAHDLYVSQTGYSTYDICKHISLLQTSEAFAAILQKFWSNAITKAMLFGKKHEKLVGMRLLYVSIFWYSLIAIASLEWLTQYQ